MRILFKIKSVWYNIRWFLWAWWSYRRIIGKMRPWDYMYIWRMMEFQLGLLQRSMEAQELIDAERHIDSIKCFRELLRHAIDDDYAERCGYRYFEMHTEPIGDGLSELKIDCTPEEAEANKEALECSHELEREEYDQMARLFRNMDEWWW